MKLSNLKLNKKNPRQIVPAKLEKLKSSIKAFEKMMYLRPIIVDEKLIVLGGNMRVVALQQLGYKDVPDEWVKQVKDLTAKEKKEFIIKDNIAFGEWDIDTLANEWDLDDLVEWGLDELNFDIEDIGDIDGGTAEPDEDPNALTEFLIVCTPAQLKKVQMYIGTDKRKVTFEEYELKVGQL